MGLAGSNACAKHERRTRRRVARRVLGAPPVAAGSPLDMRARGELPLIRRVLDPIERTSEVLFGVIMALTFTGSISVAEAGREDIREVLVGAIGCNLAWGLVDAVMYLMAAFVARAREAMTLQALRQVQTPQ